MRVLIHSVQNVIELDQEILDNFAVWFPALKKAIAPIRNQKTASLYNATHIINGSEALWLGLLKCGALFIHRVTKIHDCLKGKGLSNDEVEEKIGEIVILRKRFELNDLLNELTQAHNSLDKHFNNTEGLEAINEAKSTTDDVLASSFSNLLRSGQIQQAEKTESHISIFVEENDQKILLELSGSDKESEFLDKWLTQDGVKPILLNEGATFYFEDEDDFLVWFNNFKIHFQIELTLATLTSFFKTGKAEDDLRLEQIRHDLKKVLDMDSQALFQSRVKVWNYINSHLKSIGEGTEGFDEIKTIYDLKDRNFKLNLYS